MLFITLNTSCQPLLACNAYFEKSADSLMGTPLQVTLCFSLAAFKILYLLIICILCILILYLVIILILCILLIMCLGVVLFVSILFQTLCASWSCMSISFTKLGKESFLSLIFSNKFSISCSSSFPSGNLMIQMLVHLEMSQKLLSLSFFFFLILDVVIECFFLPYVPNH